MRATESMAGLHPDESRLGERTEFMTRVRGVGVMAARHPLWVEIRVRIPWRPLGNPLLIRCADSCLRC